jgi:Rrf2 family protein
MFGFSQTTEYAILALACIAANENCRKKVHEISACTGIPTPYLSKILHELSRSKLVDGKRGTTGGFALSCPPEQINLLQVAKAIEGEDLMPECLLGLEDCHDDGPCPTHEFWTDVRDKIHAGLAGVSIQHVAEHASDRLVDCSTCCTPEIKKEKGD